MALLRRVPFLSLLFAAPWSASADSNIVLQPRVQDQSKPEKMLVFMPGGGVPNSNYADTARAIQASATEIRLWVVIPSVFNRLCIVQCTTKSLCAPLHSAVESALSDAQAHGWNRGKDDEDMWLAGHSLGGVCANTLFQAYTSGSSVPFAGLMVFGSYVDKSGEFSVANYPKPVMILNVELDFGGARPGKTALWWQQYLAAEQAKGDEYAVANKAVIVLEKMNHSDFCPGFDVPGDLPGELDLPTAVAKIGSVVASWLHLQVGSTSSHARSSALSLLREKVTWTRQLLTPVVKALAMERKDGSGSSSPFCAEAQHVLAGLLAGDDPRLKVQDYYQDGTTGLAACKPTTKLQGSSLDIATCSHADYEADLANAGSFISASQLACKLVSGQAVAQQLGVAAARPEPDCREVNKKAVDIAESLAPRSSLERFKRLGKGFCFDSDTEVSLLWDLRASLKLKDGDLCLTVSSAAHVTDQNRFCKVLSPARALDWIMTDSLKKPKAAFQEPVSSATILA